MTISHHPTFETLAGFATGRLDAGRAIVVAAHLESCSACRAQLRLFDTVGGVLLADCEPEPMTPGALSAVMSRLEAAPAAVTSGTAGWRASSDEHPAPGEKAYLPRSVSGLKFKPWQWIGPGIHRRMLDQSEASGARVFLLKAAPGTRMPEHTHDGTELTLVLKGAFSHVGGRYGPGDFDEADDTVDHQPVVEAGEECICLVAMEGSLRLKGALGRLLQPFVRV